MRPDLVVVNAPLLDLLSGVVQASEPMQVQALVAEFAVEALNEGIPGRLAGLDKLQSDAPPLRPEEGCVTFLAQIGGGDSSQLN